MQINMRGLGAACCTPDQTADPSFQQSADGTQGYYNTAYGPGLCDATCTGINITGGSGTTAPLACCTTAQQSSPLWANLPSGDIRYLISDSEVNCNPNCSGGVPSSITPTVILMIAALGAVVLLVASR